MLPNAYYSANIQESSGFSLPCSNFSISLVSLAVEFLTTDRIDRIFEFRDFETLDWSTLLNGLWYCLSDEVFSFHEIFDTLNFFFSSGNYEFFSRVCLGIFLSRNFWHVAIFSTAFQFLNIISEFGGWIFDHGQNWLWYLQGIFVNVFQFFQGIFD